MNTEHTPGPWQKSHGGDNQHTIVQPRTAFSMLIARVCEPDHGDAEANARLIAAAPDLLDALKGLAKQVRARFRLDVRKHYSLMLAIAAAHKAIDKATGNE